MSDFDPIEEVIEALQAGQMIVLVDERAVDVDGSELVGEGELMMIAELADSNSVHFLARHAGGPVYVAAETNHLEKLGLDAASAGATGPRGCRVRTACGPRLSPQ